ncbi:MAG: FxsA family protein [Gammaproteobacteria bacterium]|nr:FxsA family protein [Gammaproteobacteria bacterium]
MGIWLVVFFLTPIIEMYLLIRVGGYIGAWPTIGLVMLTAVIGVALLRIQGLATLTRGMGRLQGGELPAREMAEGILLAVAGALLITPGFVTDGFGFLLLLPPARAAVAERMLGRVVVMGQGGFGEGSRPGGRSHQPGAGSRPGGRSHSQGPVVIEGEFESRSESERGPERERDDPDQRLP